MHSTRAVVSLSGVAHPSRTLADVDRGDEAGDVGWGRCFVQLDVGLRVCSAARDGGAVGAGL